ncbi:hypothetical protein [Pseudogemmobacter sonorensis]|uniref:hypothetical protein n=1 Tax=Pseudogemmobacter sonorensis TaxID=2989681 RepID=UPI0036CAF2B2
MIYNGFEPALAALLAGEDRALSEEGAEEAQLHDGRLALTSLALLVVVVAALVWLA